MNTRPDIEKAQRRRKGQTLAEFAITLPVLLILTFGVIEFGRVFQAWVTLQNAARAGARYASTGRYDETRFVMDTEFLSTWTNPNTGQTERYYNDPTGFIPCVNDGPEDYRQYGPAEQRGTVSTIYPNQSGDADDAIQVYNGGLESLFATWNFGKNCDPLDTADQDRRKDMARLLSIMDETRRGAAGLSLEANTMNIPTAEEDKKEIDGWPWFDVWTVPFTNEQQKSWFNVTVCSTRDMLLDSSTNYYKRTDAATGNTVPVNSRFTTYVGDGVLLDPSNRALTADPSSEVVLPSVGCMLNEVMTDTSGGIINNAGRPWMDPGGPGDTVTVIVTFNHPLIMPLVNQGSFIRMQARRSAIVESFRGADPSSAFNNVNLEPPPVPPTLTPSLTYTPTQTFTPTLTPTKTPTITPTYTPSPPPPFSCNLISINPVPNGNNPGLFNNTVGIEINNGNAQPTYITRAILKWPTIQDYPSMYVNELALNSAPHWKGRDVTDTGSTTNTTDTNTDSSIPANYFTSTSESDRTVGPNDTGIWTAEFSNGPQLQDYVTINHFGGTTFYLYNPLTPTTPCQIQLTLPPPLPTPTRNPLNPTNTPTYTPDCVGPLISITFRGFEQFGIVRLEVSNQRTVVSGLTNFTIQWPQKLPGVLTLDRVTAVAPPGQSGSVEIWRASSATQDSTPPTVGKSEGVWVQNFTFPARSVTPLFLDFGGVGGYLSDPGVGMRPSDFNGTQFQIGCGGPGGTGGTGSPTSGLITLASAPTPAPTSPPGPSNTPRPTLPPTATPTKGPPTKTPTVGPTPTTRPTNTPLPPPTATNRPPPPTLPGGGCVDGCN